LAFHPYPQVIPQVFNPGGFGPPRGLTRASTCPWVDHPASGLQHATPAPYSDSLSLRLPHHGLTLPHTVTRRLILQKARGHFTPATSGGHAPTACRHTVSGTISRPLTGVLFTFPSRYWSTIGHQGVFRLRRWSSQIHTRFLGPRATWDPARESRRFRLRGYHPLRRRFPAPSATRAIYHSPPGQQPRLGGPATPATQHLLAITRDRFGLFPFRSPLLRESRLLSLPVGTEMFHFPTLPPAALCVQTAVTGHYTRRVSPFGNPRIKVWLPTPRGLSQAPTSFIGS
jgi:hypothetical protein